MRTQSPGDPLEKGFPALSQKQMRWLFAVTPQLDTPALQLDGDRQGQDLAYRMCVSVEHRLQEPCVLFVSRPMYSRVLSVASSCRNGPYQAAIPAFR